MRFDADHVDGRLGWAPRSKRAGIALAFMCLIIASASRAGVAIGETESTASWHSRHSQPDPKLAPKPGKPVAKKGVLAVPDGIGVTRDVEYARVEGRKLLLDIYLPEAPAKATLAPPATPATSAPGDAGKEPSTIQPDVHEPGEADGASRATSTGRHQARPPLPVIIWIHGGGWESGTKDASPAARLVSFGYAAVSISYRFSQIAPYPAQIHDCKAAIRWVRAHAKEYNFDPDRIGVWGASAGGHLAALLGTSAGDQELEGEIGGHLDQSSAVQAVCDWFGPTDMIKLCRMASGESAEDAALPRPDFVIPARNKGETSTQRKDAAPAATTADDKVPPRSYPKLITPAPLRKLFGGNIQDHLQLAVLANPVTFIDKSDAPVFIVHGDRDSLVPLDQSTLFKAALEQAGVQVKLHLVEGGGHGFWNDQLLNMVKEFFDEHLKPKKAEMQGDAVQPTPPPITR